jgi:hypothetical protein
MAFYDKIVQIWDRTLEKSASLDIAQRAEGIQILNSILMTKSKATPDAGIIKLVMYTLSKIHYMSKNYQEAVALAAASAESNHF